MRTPKRLYSEERIIYHPELLTCPHCGDLLVMWNSPYSIGLSGGQLPSYVEGSSALDFPLIHDTRSQSQA